MVARSSRAQKAPPEFRELRKNRMSDQVAGALQSAIASGAYELGERLPGEQELADTFKTSRGTVREALRVLEAMGFVEIRTGAGSFVAESPFGSDALRGRLSWLLDRREVVLEILEVREALEAPAARRYARGATAEDVAELSATLEEMRAAVADDDPDRFAAADADLHVKIGSRCGNQMLGEIIGYVEEVYRASNRVLMDMRDRHVRVLAEHEAIVEAIAAQNGDGAEIAMREHLRSVSGQIAQLAEGKRS